MSSDFTPPEVERTLNGLEKARVELRAARGLPPEKIKFPFPEADYDDARLRQEVDSERKQADGGAGFDVYDHIVCAALRHESGAIITGVRHFDPLMRDQINSHVIQGWRSAEQGFVNAKGIFLNRKDALHVALFCGQRIKRCGGDEGQLFSENLY